MIPSRLRLSLVDGELVVCRLPEGANVPTPADGALWALVATPNETSVVCAAGLREGSGGDTPPLDAGAGGRLRVREVLTGVGGRAC